MKMTAVLDELFHESNFHSLSSLSSIYGATKITEPNGQNKLLIAMLKSKIASYEYKKAGDSLTKLDKEVTFTYIPADANVVSIDSFYCEDRGMVIAIAFIKEANGKLASFLNIYYNYTYDISENKAMHELETVAENCRTFELLFIPFQLAHCKTKARNGGKLFFVCMPSLFYQYCNIILQAMSVFSPRKMYVASLQVNSLCDRSCNSKFD